jgi:monofunctional biosynthetic peptidoglycan transglycosylase
MVRAIKRRRPGKKRGGFRRIIGWIIRAFFLFVILSILWVLLYRFVPPPVTFTQIGDLVGGRSISRDWMALDRIDDDMKRAAIAAEDSKFCSHWGFDQDAIAEAMRRNAQGDGVMRGGSTISQQTAKNAFLWQGGGYFRKGLEAWFTLLIENLWSKERIMEVYLNVAETGIATYGVNAGSQRYFGHDASTMTRTEAARIAAVLPLPKRREAKTPVGFTRRYGNSIAARIGVVQRDGLDACLYGKDDIASPVERDPVAPRPKAKAAPRPLDAPAPAGTPGDDYEQPAIAEPDGTQPPPAASEPPPVPVEEPAELNGL